METVFSSLHTHTVFCDGKDDIETMCRAAFEKGLAAIGFSAHAPVDTAGLETSWHLPRSRLEAYVEEVHAARLRWKDKIAVYLGFEVDYIRGLRSALDNDIKAVNPDYIISSVHYLVPPRGAPFTVDGPAAEVEKGLREGYGGDGEAMMHAYWDAAAEMIASGGFNIIAHLDLIRKNDAAILSGLPIPEGKTGRFNVDGTDYKRRVAEIVQAIAAAGLTAEINTGGLNRGYATGLYPAADVLPLLRLHKIPVMISADAHRAGDIAGNYDTARQALREAGYSNHVIFSGRDGGKAMWREYGLGG